MGKMRSKSYYTFALAFLFIILYTSIASADYGVYKQGKPIDIKLSCDLIACGDPTSIVISLPNTTNVVNSSMTQFGGYLNYTFTGTTEIGTYRFFVFADDTVAADDYYTDTFEVTYLGEKASTSQSIIYMILFSVMIFVFFMIIFFINLLPASNMKDEEGRILSITYLKYFRLPLWFIEWMLFIAILYLSSSLAFAYLGEELFAQILFVLFRVCFGFTPVILIVMIIWMFVKMFHDKQFQNMLNRGIFPEGKI